MDSIPGALTETVGPPSATRPPATLQLTVETASLARSLRVVERAVSDRAAKALPILQHLLLTADDGRLTLTASDGYCAIKAACLAVVEVPGRVALSARLFADYVDRLTADRVTLIADPDRGRVRVVAGRASASIGAADPDAFPALPDPPFDRALTLDSAGLRRMIERVAPFAAESDARPILSTISCRFDERGLTAAATDGNRVARARCAILASGGDAIPEFLIPARVVGQLARLLRDDSPTYLMTLPGRNGCWFVHGAVAIYSQLVEGAFPDIDQFVPAEATTSCTVDAVSLGQALGQAGLFDERAAARSVLFHVADDTLTVFAGGDGAGEGVSEIDADVTGDGGTLVLDTRYVKNLLGGSAPARLVFAWEGQHKPVAVRDAARRPGEVTADDVWVIMPQYG